VIFWRNFKDIILSLLYPKNKLYIVSYPNSGRTWLKHMLLEIFAQLDVEDYNIEFTHDNSEIIIEDGTRIDPNTIFKYTRRYKYLRAKVIFLCRDPRDIITSNYHQVTKRAKNPFSFNNKSEFIQNEILGFKRIIHFFNLWANNKSIPNKFLLIRYENLLSGINELENVLSFMNINAGKQLITKVYNGSSADKMRIKEKNNQIKGFTNFGNEVNQMKVRKAKKGSYLSELSVDDINFCNNEMSLLNKYFKYKI